MTRRQAPPPLEPMLTVGQAAELLGTTERFPRRLIAERRIEFVHIGRHVRIPESALRAFIEENTVEPVPAGVRRKAGLWVTTQAADGGSVLSAG